MDVILNIAIEKYIYISLKPVAYQSKRIFEEVCCREPLLDSKCKQIKRSGIAGCPKA